MHVDPEVVRAVQRGDDGAMENLIRLTYADVHALCLRLVKDPADASDATQEVFVRMMRSVVAFRGDAQFATWLHRVTVNTCATYLRKRGDRRHRGELAGYEAFAAPDGRHEVSSDNDLEVEVGDRQHAAEIARAVNELAAEDRDVIVLRDVEGLSTKQAAKVLGISEGAVKVRLHRARARLREAVDA